MFHISIVLCRRLLDRRFNGIVNCFLGNDGVPTYKDTCSFRCKPGYVLTGSYKRTCLSDGSWSGKMTICKRGVCVFINLLVNKNHATYNFATTGCCISNLWSILCLRLYKMEA